MPGGDSADRVDGRYDDVTLSNRGRVVALAARAVAASPDVRAEKVAALKAAIADGNYGSDARAIARRLLPSLAQE
jgi:negative regulator of flagellin synthesis FlgM